MKFGYFFIRLLAGCWSLAGALDTISLDITEFRAGNLCCYELVVLCDWGRCFASFVWWLWHRPSAGGVMVAGWGGGGGVGLQSGLHGMHS